GQMMGMGGSGSMMGMGGSGSMMGMGGMMGMMGGLGGIIPDQNFTPLLAVAVVEVDKWAAYEPNPPQKSGIIHAHHKYSLKNGSYILPITTDRKLTASLLKSPTIHQRYLDQVKESHPNGKADPLKLLPLAEWTLKHGLLDEFVKVMDELGK